MTAKIIDFQDAQARQLGFRDCDHLIQATQSEWEADIDAALRAAGIDPNNATPDDFESLDGCAGATP